MASAKSVKLSDREVTRIARALAEPRRVQILKQIGGCTNGALACRLILEKQDIAPATLSHHLKELETANLIETSRDGKLVLVSVKRDVLNALLKAIKARAKAADVQGDSIQQAHASALSASEQLSTDLAASRAQLAELEQLAAAAAQTDAALATLHTSAAASAQNAEDAKQQASAALDTIAAANERVATLTAEVVGVRAQMDEAAATVATKSAHIEEGRLHADSVRATLDSSVAKSKEADEATTAALETVRTKVNELARMPLIAEGRPSSGRLDYGREPSSLRWDASLDSRQSKRTWPLARSPGR